jgi:hypothetical protein
VRCGRAAGKPAYNALTVECLSVRQFRRPPKGMRGGNRQSEFERLRDLRGQIVSAEISNIDRSASSSRLAAAPSPRRFRIWVDDPAGFSTNRVTAIHHDFHEHPLMQLPRLAQLARDLMPHGLCRFIKPGTRQDSVFNHNPRATDGRSIDEVFERIDEPGSWIAIYHAETDPAYRDFLREVIESVRPMVEAQQPGIFLVTGFIFISAPPSVTPFHIDRENNFWLQIRGRKTMNVWDHTDRFVVPAHAVDEFIVYGSLDEVRLRDGFVERSHQFDVGPGDGVYFPSTSPHMTRSDPGWTRPGDGVCISIGVDFYTQHTRRVARIHALNAFLRKFGLIPREPGGDAWRDSLKAALGAGYVWGKKTFRGYEPKNGL